MQTPFAKVVPAIRGKKRHLIPKHS